MKMSRLGFAGILPVFVLLLATQPVSRALCSPPQPQAAPWLTAEDDFSYLLSPLSRVVASITKVTALPQPGQLSVADRVAYQRAIEEVYWRHRIWPKERAGPKPSLDAVMSPAQIQQKVQDYLRDSELFEEEWQKPISPEQLQAEMERMAQHTKAPKVLRELFAALGNDPFVVAECLARPVLSERVQFAALESRKEPLESQSENRHGQMPNMINAANSNYTLPAISGQPSDCIDDSWTATSTTNAPSGRENHTAVWTGSEMIVWGGLDGSINPVNTGGRYNPSTDSWTATSTTNAPTGRAEHTAVWTGTEMIVWGGTVATGSSVNTGGRYNPITDNWTATSTANAPIGRRQHTAVWTGTEMIVWGGTDNGANKFNTGGRYNPGTDSWTATTMTNAPAGRFIHAAVWTGSEMIVWGGNGSVIFLNTGGRYNPSSDSWTATSTTSAPTGRWYPTAVWTGTEMIVWGGVDNSGILNTGGRYSPGSDNWTATSTTNAPTARYIHRAVWTGNEMIVWGGTDNQIDGLNTGGRYTPGSDSWTAMSTTDAPAGRYIHTALWTGAEMIVWGGFPGFLNTGGRYCAQAGAGGLTLESAASIQRGFAIDLPLSGPSGVEDRSGGPNKKFYVAMTFNNNITSVGSATSTCGGVSSWSIDGCTVTFKLVGVAHGCNASDIMISATDVMDDTANTLSSASVTMGLLLGDVNGDRVVDATDPSIVRSQRGQHTDGTKFRSDVSNDGYINASDVHLVRQQQGTSLP